MSIVSINQTGQIQKKKKFKKIIISGLNIDIFFYQIIILTFDTKTLKLYTILHVYLMLFRILHFVIIYKYFVISHL